MALNKPQAHPQIKKVIAIASGKGGVGKSTCAVNLALALARQPNLRIGILDADIYGPSQPTMLGVPANTRPQQSEQGLMPIMRFGLQTMSIGYLINEQDSLVWRGPMASGALQQLFHDTLWDNLDYLIIDMPPGTGDIPLTLAQKIPVNHAIVVTTPQDVALKDVERAILMFKKVKIPVLGIIENMSMYRCTNCNHQEHIFGQGAAQKINERYHLDVLASIELNTQIQLDVDSGTPSLAGKSNRQPIEEVYLGLAQNLHQRCLTQPKDYINLFSNIEVKYSTEKA